MIKWYKPSEKMPEIDDDLSGPTLKRSPSYMETEKIDDKIEQKFKEWFFKKYHNAKSTYEAAKIMILPVFIAGYNAAIEEKE